MSESSNGRLPGLITGLVVVAVALAAVSYYGWQRVGDLEIQVVALEDRLENEITEIRSEIAATSLRLTSTESDLNIVAGSLVSVVDDVNDLKGFNWSRFDRNLGEIDASLMDVEDCLGSIVNIVEGFGTFLDFSCSSVG